MLVSVEWLQRHLDSVRLLDVRGEVATEQPRYRAHPEHYREGHIPGAVFADWRVDFTDRTSAVPVTVAPPAVFAADATRLGIGADTVVVAYDHYFNVLAGRIVLVLRSYGHAASHVLDGGLSAWTSDGRPLEGGPRVPDRQRHEAIFVRPAREVERDRPVASLDVGTRPADGRDDVEDDRGAMVGTVRESHLRLTRHTRLTVVRGEGRGIRSSLRSREVRPPVGHGGGAVATLVTTVMSASAQLRLAGQQPSSAVGCSG